MSALSETGRSGTGRQGVVGDSAHRATVAHAMSSRKHRLVEVEEILILLTYLLDTWCLCL